MFYTFELKMKRKLGSVGHEESSAKRQAYPLKPSPQWMWCQRVFECYRYKYASELFGQLCEPCFDYMSLSAEAQGELWERCQMRREGCSYRKKERSSR